MSDRRGRPALRPVPPVHIALEQLVLWHNLLRAQTRQMLGLFRLINIVIISFVVVLWLVDELHFQCAAPGDMPPRLITTQVVLALIAASTAQLGLLAVAIGRAIFKQLDLAPRDALS